MPEGRSLRASCLSRHVYDVFTVVPAQTLIGLCLRYMCLNITKIIQYLETHLVTVIVSCLPVLCTAQIPDILPIHCSSLSTMSKEDELIAQYSDITGANVADASPS